MRAISRRLTARPKPLNRKKERMMAQAPRTGIPPAPPATRPPSSAPGADQRQPPHQQVNIHGQPPQPNMAPPEEAPSGLGDNTRAEMEAGRNNLQQYSRRDNAEHEAGRRAIGRGEETNPPE